MKEIKAYIRPEMADRVLSALEMAGVRGMYDDNRRIGSLGMD
jgi:nitrogen regulatory protein PII